jgi:GNAT superfamily N-acetyltransferase
VEDSAVSSGAPELRFRRGRADDWPTAALIVAGIWEGEDYIDERLWRFWAEDQKGALLVATLSEGPLGERLVAFGKLTCLGPAEWWMEGMRVDPAHHREGIGRGLHHHMIRVFREIGDGLLRLSTVSLNEPIHRLAAETSFRHIMSYMPAHAAALPGEDVSSLARLRAPNLEMAARYLANSPMNRVNRYVEHRSILYYLTTERLRGYLADEEIEIVGWRGSDGRLRGLAILLPEHSPVRPFEREDSEEPLRLRIGYFDAADDTTLTRMGLALRALAAARGYEQVAWKAPLSVGLERLMPILGFEREWDADLWLFELPLNP